MFIVMIDGADSFIAADKEAIFKGLEEEFAGACKSVVKSSHGYTVDWVAGDDDYVGWVRDGVVNGDSLITANAITSEFYQ